MANRHRGEVALTLDGKTYVLRPTFEALAEMENLRGVGIVSLAARFVAGRYGLQDAAAVIYAGALGAAEGGTEPALTYEQAGALVTRHGVTRVAEALCDFLKGALDPFGEAEKAAASGNGTAPGAETATPGATT